jgi:hypothetical protein
MPCPIYFCCRPAFPGSAFLQISPAYLSFHKKEFFVPYNVNTLRRSLSVLGKDAKIERSIHAVFLWKKRNKISLNNLQEALHNLPRRKLKTCIAKCSQNCTTGGELGFLGCQSVPASRGGEGERDTNQSLVRPIRVGRRVLQAQVTVAVAEMRKNHADAALTLASSIQKNRRNGPKTRI